ncbi:MAG TPA: secretion system protein [Anaerolineae bacterium]|nr:secretion system protein [Chloroflexota bacterium]HID52748.1 secretion system protein [Anaerolineae bacterium]
MPPLLIVIALASVFLILGAGAAIVLGGGQSSVDDRLEQFVGTSTTVVDIPDEDVDSAGPDVADRLDKALSGRGFFETTRERLAKADLKLRVSEYFVVVILAAVGGGLLGYYVPKDNNPVLGVVGFIIGSQIPKWYVKHAAGKRMRAFDNQLSDTLNLWVNALRSGYSVLQGMEAIATELPPPVSVEFERVVQEVRLGLSVEAALDNMYRRVPSEDLDLIITAVNIQREVGGNLAEVLESISHTIRERVRIKGEIRTLTAQGRISGTIISLLPIVLGGLLFMINPGYVSELWVKEPPFIIPNVFPCGWILLGIGAIMIFFGWLAIRKIVDIEV